MSVSRIGLALIMVLLTAVVAQAAPEFYVAVTGTLQGPFKGETPRQGFEGKIVGLSFNSELVSPRDPGTGLVTGKRVHSPIRIKKAWGPASLQFYAALVKNEALTITMDFFAPDKSGQLVLDHSIKLGNAVVASYRSHADSDVNLGAPQTDLIEFVFQQIDIVDHKGKGSVRDTWLAPQ